MEYGITAKEKNKDVYYFINWSPLAKADRYEIITKVPAISGIFEIYWMDENNRLRMFFVDKTNYGGLRSEIRRITDPELCKTGKKAKRILEEKEIWYRYVPSSSANIMADLFWFFMQNYLPENKTISHSGRYENIFVEESAPDRLIWVP
jgi:hypothetical protein